MTSQKEIIVTFGTLGTLVLVDFVLASFFHNDGYNGIAHFSGLNPLHLILIITIPSMSIAGIFLIRLLDEIPTKSFKWYVLTISFINGIICAMVSLRFLPGLYFLLSGGFNLFSFIMAIVFILFLTFPLLANALIFKTFWKKETVKM